MSRENIKSLKPFFSLIVIISTLFSIVFCKLEIRRMGYMELRLAKQQSALRDAHRAREIELARETRPQRLRQVAERGVSRSALPGHIIQVAGEHLVLIQ